MTEFKVLAVLVCLHNFQMFICVAGNPVALIRMFIQLFLRLKSHYSVMEQICPDCWIQASVQNGLNFDYSVPTCEISSRVNRTDL